MKKGLFMWMIITAIIMLGLPWFGITFAPANAGMAVCFLLWYAVNPVYSVLSGVYAGMEIKKRWWLPAAVAVLYVAGTWMFFEFGSIVFLAFGAVYLAIAAVAMLISGLVRYSRSGKNRSSVFGGD